MYLNLNIKYLRESENLSQEQFGVRFGLTRGQVATYESGKSEPSIETVLAIVTFYNIHVADIVTKSINSIGEFKDGRFQYFGAQSGAQVGHNSAPNDENDTKNDKNTVLEPSNRYEVEHNLGASKKSIQVLPIVTDATNTELIVAVPFYAEAGYTTGYQDTEYIKDLPNFSVPWLRDGTYRAFQIRGDSMESDLKSGDWVVGRYVTTLKSLQVGTICVVLLKDEGIVCKRVEKLKGNTVILHSNNEKYKPIHPDQDAILEMWEVKMLLRNFYA
jgi:transcriptional regulator with XRE-family HTH domain